MKYRALTPASRDRAGVLYRRGPDGASVNTTFRGLPKFARDAMLSGGGLSREQLI